MNWKVGMDFGNTSSCDSCPPLMSHLLLYYRPLITFKNDWPNPKTQVYDFTRRATHCGHMDQGLTPAHRPTASLDRQEQAGLGCSWGPPGSSGGCTLRRSPPLGAARRVQIGCTHYPTCVSIGGNHPLMRNFCGGLLPPVEEIISRVCLTHLEYPIAGAKIPWFVGEVAKGSVAWRSVTMT